MAIRWCRGNQSAMLRSVSWASLPILLSSSLPVLLPTSLLALLTTGWSSSSIFLMEERVWNWGNLSTGPSFACVQTNETGFTPCYRYCPEEKPSELSQIIRKVWTVYRDTTISMIKTAMFQNLNILTTTEGHEQRWRVPSWTPDVCFVLLLPNLLKLMEYHSTLYLLLADQLVLYFIQIVFFLLIVSLLVALSSQI
jgi:hypothetical protein